MYEDYEAYCMDGRQAVSMVAYGGDRAVFVASDNKPDLIAECLDGYQIARVRPVENISSALMMLSFRPFSPLWEQMEGEWGEDLGLLRAELEVAARNATDPGLGLSMDSDIARDIARARSLRAIGYTEEARVIFDRLAERINSGSESRLRRLEFERALVASYQATTAQMLGSVDEAARIMGEFLEEFPEDSDYRLNPEINYAAFLAEAGDYRASYRVIVPAYDAFRGQGYDPETYTLGGADREFAWIIACNRWNMDKEEAAQPFIDIVQNAPEQPRDEYVANVPRSTRILRRMYRCIGDADGWYAQFGDGSLPALDEAWTMLQPAYGGENAPLPDWQMPERTSARYNELYRHLPETYAPALRNWRDSEDGE